VTTPAVSASSIINLTNWTDTVRQPGFEAYQKLHPNIHFTYEVQASGSATGAVINGVTLQQKTMAKMLDVLVSNKTVSTVYPFAASFGSVMKNALMMPGADWFGAYIFDATYKQPAKTWAAAVTPSWTADGTHWTGDEGGGSI
jgi:hypothetical protein